MRSPLDALCLEISRSDGIRSCAPMVFSEYLVSEEHCEALLVVTSMGHTFSFHGEAGGECHRNRDLRTNNDCSSLCGDMESSISI
jgi:hypothetical protein